MLRVLALALVLPAAARAQVPLVADRPGLTLTPLAVPTGSVQIEVGLPQVTRTTLTDSGVTGFSTPTTVRVGVASRLELRVGGSGFNARTAPGVGTVTGLGDVEIGAKYEGLSPGADGFALGLTAGVTLPVGSDAFSGEQAVASLSSAFGFALPAGASASVLLGAFAPPEDLGAASAVLAGAVGRPLSLAVGAYIEAGAVVSSSASPVLAGAGLTWLVAPRLQFDASFDVGLTDPLFTAGVGLTTRFGR